MARAHVLHTFIFINAKRSGNFFFNWKTGTWIEVGSMDIKLASMLFGSKPWKNCDLTAPFIASEAQARKGFGEIRNPKLPGIVACTLFAVRKGACVTREHWVAQDKSDRRGRPHLSVRF